MTKLCTLCQLFLVIGLAGSSNAAWPLQTRIDDAVARHGAEVCPGLGRPFALMRDIRDKTHALVVAKESINFDRASAEELGRRYYKAWKGIAK